MVYITGQVQIIGTLSGKQKIHVT